MWISMKMFGRGGVEVYVGGHGRLDDIWMYSGKRSSRNIFSVVRVVRVIHIEVVIGAWFLLRQRR